MLKSFLHDLTEQTSLNLRFVVKKIFLMQFLNTAYVIHMLNVNTRHTFTVMQAKLDVIHHRCDHDDDGYVMIWSGTGGRENFVSLINLLHRIKLGKIVS